MFRNAWRATFATLSKAEPATWGASTSPGARTRRSGWSGGGGSPPKTSMPAPPSAPDSSASARATSSTISPRAVLMTIAPGRSRAMRSRESMARVARV